jgi:hypothetical protein
MMKVFPLLLCSYLPFSLARLGGQSEEREDPLDLNLTYGEAVNEIRAFYSDRNLALAWQDLELDDNPDNLLIDFDVPFDLDDFGNESLPSERLPANEIVTTIDSSDEGAPLAEGNSTMHQDARKLQSYLAQQWINAHNKRRRQFHSQNRMSYRPLQWSSKLANSAAGYARRLATIPGCKIRHGYQGDSYGGENIASDWGGKFDFQPPEQVLYRWYENEANDPWPQNGHRTQVAWRGTRYVGCGEARKSYKGGHCKIQVCRYIAPGNCNVGTKSLRSLMLQERSMCGPQTP